MKNTNDKVKSFMNKLFQKYYPCLHELVNGEIPCASIAEDIIQETFYEALRTSDKLFTEAPGEWLKETARRKAAVFNAKFMERSMEDALYLAVSLSCLEAANGLSELSFLADQPISLHEKTLFHMYYYGGYTTAELAKIERISEDDFRMEMHRICSELLKKARETRTEEKKEKE